MLCRGPEAPWNRVRSMVWLCVCGLLTRCRRQDDGYARHPCRPRQTQQGPGSRVCTFDAARAGGRLEGWGGAAVGQSARPLLLRCTRRICRGGLGSLIWWLYEVVGIPPVVMKIYTECVYDQTRAWAGCSCVDGIPSDPSVLAAVCPLPTRRCSLPAAGTGQCRAGEGSERSPCSFEGCAVCALPQRRHPARRRGDAAASLCPATAS